MARNLKVPQMKLKTGLCEDVFMSHEPSQAHLCGFGMACLAIEVSQMQRCGSTERTWKLLAKGNLPHGAGLHSYRGI